MFEPFALEPEPIPPVLPGTVVVRPTYDELIDAAGADLFLQARACVREFGTFHLAISAWGLPEVMVRRLLCDPALRDLPWDRTHVWAVEEHAKSPTGGASQFLGQMIAPHAGIPASHVHLIGTGRPDADLRYEQELHEALCERPPGHDRLDFVMLGVDADATTAAWGQDAGADDRLVGWIGSGAESRVVMSPRLVNASRVVGVIVSRAFIGDAMPDMIDGRAQAVRTLAPRAGELRWYIDPDLCELSSGGIDVGA